MKRTSRRFPRAVLLHWVLAAGSFLAAFFLVGSSWGQPANTFVHTGRPPTWVELTEPGSPAAISSAASSGGQVFDLLDTQVNQTTVETYVHVVKEITTEAGVQSGGNLSFSWDPSYQELIAHRITLWRGAEHLDRLDPARFKIIQQESDLDRQIYNGTLSAVLFVEDVRPGDRIEYDFTLRGLNPSLSGRFSDSLLLGWPMPIEHRRIRLLWPEGRFLSLALHGIEATPEVRHHDGLKEYIWDLRDLPAVMVEDQIPSWYAPYPWLQLSEFPDWEAVAGWAAGLFITTNSEAPELQAVITSFQQSGRTPEQQVDQALRFVQNKVRYLGLEFGPYSYRPTDPVLVLQHRFGDCKDKAFLLATLLRKMGFEADPVLVATGFRQTLQELLPAPSDFDHAIVRVSIAGKAYWLDPTRTYQHGDFANRYRPDYAYGLPVSAGTTNLAIIPASETAPATTVTKEVFQVGGQKAPTELSVTSIYSGFDAEWMRAYLDIQGRERVAAGYLNDYAQRYPGARRAAPMEVVDAADQELLTLTQHFTITNFWILSADKQRYECQFYSQGIHSWVAKPATTVRAMPMELAFPRRREVETKIELPIEFRLSNVTNTIRGPAATLHMERNYLGQTVWLRYEYQALTNFVPVSLVAEHLASLDQMENALGYSLKWQSLDEAGQGSQFNWPVFLLTAVYAMLFAGGAGFLAIWHCRKAARWPAEPPPLDQRLNGLGGWLILVGLRLVLGPITLLHTIEQSLGNFSLLQWHALTAPGGVSYHPFWGPMLVGELLAEISLLILVLVVGVLFLQRRRIFPYWFIALQLASTSFGLADLVGIHFLKVVSQKAPPQNAMVLVVSCAIWIPYMLLSRRVKGTFTR